MAPAREVLKLNTDFDPQTGTLVAVAPGIGRVTAPNGGPYTFTGTNTFLIGVRKVIVIDPGPDDSKHLAALTAAIGGRPVEAILLTHTHKDHSALASRLRASTGAPIWFGGKHHLSRKPRLLERNAIARSSDWSLVPDRVLSEGDSVGVEGMTLGVIATPGHCANHIAYSVAGTPYLIVGDHVMGWSTTMVAPPDGSMAQYFASLDKVITAPFTHYLPAHGGPIPEGRKFTRGLLAHRQERNMEILVGISSGANTVGKLLVRIYQDISPRLKLAARVTLSAHLEYLIERGDIAARRGLFGVRYNR